MYIYIQVQEAVQEQGPRNKIFNNSKYGKSNWFMPLRYHGDGVVEQFGDKQK